eukprot:2107979-Rhodomonas_salina.1
MRARCDDCTGIQYAPVSNTRNRIAGTNCTDFAVSCIRFRGVAARARALRCAVLRNTVCGAEEHGVLPGNIDSYSLRLNTLSSHAKG